MSIEGWIIVVFAVLVIVPTWAWIIWIGFRENYWKPMPGSWKRR